jgi:hypothetical protein
LKKVNAENTLELTENDIKKILEVWIYFYFNFFIGL